MALESWFDPDFRKETLFDEDLLIDHWFDPEWDLQSNLVSDTIDNVGVASQLLTSAEAITETISNTGTNTPLIAEFVPEPDMVSIGAGTQTISEATAETISNSASITQSLSVEATAETDNNSATATILTSDFETDVEINTGTGSPTISDATAETVDNHGGVPGSGAYGEGEYGEGAYGEGASGELQTILEAIAETVSNSATATISIGEVTPGDGETLTSEGTATLRINETEVGSETGSGTGGPSLSEAIAETLSNSATATILVSDFQSEEEANTGTGAPTITESVAEGADNSATSSQSFDEQTPEINLTSVALSTQSLVEAITETLINSATSTQTSSESESDSLRNSATATHSIADLETDNITNSGNGTPRISEATAETDGNSGSNDPEFDESTHITVVPFSDLLTGTWTVEPLYEKIDEFYPIGGYPTESIRSGNNPVNDKAILGLAPISDPGIDTEHYINIQFYKQGDETLDFTVNLKEGSTLIATRTFTDVTETQSNPRLEQIALTSLEASAIIDYSNLNIELIANQTS